MKQRTNRERVYYGLLKDILQGRIGPGEKLVESEIAAQFNVSRTPVREAILQLTKRGVATHKPNVGAVVKKFSNEQVIEFVEILSLLESCALESLSIDSITNQDILYLKKLNKQMIEICKNQEFLHYWSKNEEFHLFLLKRCRNKSLVRIASDLRKQIFRAGMTMPWHSREYLSDHKDIIDMIAQRDFPKAAQVMRRHMNNVKTKYTQIFEELQGSMQGDAEVS